MTLLQNDATLYYKTRQLFLLQNEANLYYKTRQLFYYKTRQVLQNAPFLLQNAAGITKCADYYKTRHNNLNRSATLRFGLKVSIRLNLVYLSLLIIFFAFNIWHLFVLKLEKEISDKVKVEERR